MKAEPIPFVTIPAGRFLMGGIPEDKFVTSNELPRREVVIRSFRLAAHPVTRAQWHGTADVKDPSLPVTGVSFAEASEFAARHASRLPSEAEWEFACRAGSATVFPSATNLESADANFLYDECGAPVGIGAPTPVCKYPPNAFGLHDMIGNVCEWVADHWRADFRNAPASQTAWLDPDASRRVIRGGAWDHLPRLLRCSWRDWAPESARWDNLGFRLARDIPTS